MEISQREQGLSLLHAAKLARQRGKQVITQRQAGSGKNRPTQRPQSRRISQCSRKNFAAFSRLHAFGLHRRMEWHGENLGLSLSWFAFRGDRSEERRVGKEW